MMGATEATCAIVFMDIAQNHQLRGHEHHRE